MLFMIIFKIIIENISTTEHRRYCILCDYNEIDSDSGWQGDNNTHWKVCEICNPNGEHKILEDVHVDADNNNVCDVCNKVFDIVPPNAFDDGDIEIISRSTYQIEVRAKTEDNTGGLGLASYEFSINDGSTWYTVDVADDSQYASNLFDGLTHNTNYTILVRAIDKVDNYIEGSINTSTYEVPPELVEATLSKEEMTSGTVTVSLALPTLSLPQNVINGLKIVYRIDGTSLDWEDYSTPISVTREATTIIYAKIVDKRTPTPNSSSAVKTINITNIDKTAPTVTISGTNTTTINTSHTATVRIIDAKAGVEEDARVYYAWSTSDTVEPSSYTQFVTVPSTGNDVTVNITTPSGVTGRFYLWIKEGIEDAVGNATTQPTVSSIYFEVDDVAAELTVRTMRNEEDDVLDALFVRTGKRITINMTANKELSTGPLVEIITPTGTLSARGTSSNGINWVATINVTETLTEVLLNNVKYSDYTSTSGKAGLEYTTNSDGEYMTYDKTLPVLNYVNK